MTIGHEHHRHGAPPSLILGVDTGGTFTDLVMLDGAGRLAVEKTFSTPARPDEAVIEVAARLAARQSVALAGLLARTVRFAHGTTVGTNAIVERDGARVGLLTTRGFEDTLEIARGPLGRAGGLAPSLAMDFVHCEPPPPLVPKTRIRGLNERIAASGAVLAPLDEDATRTAIEELLADGIESLAVCLLWSFRNPAHERKVGEIARTLAPDLPLSLSSDIAPRLGEFERTATTAANAFVGPRLAGYIEALQGKLKDNGLARPLQVMTASGGVTLPERVPRQAVSVVHSGPVGGLIAARWLGAALGHEDVITADMGGTSFDVGLIAGGRFAEETTPFLDQGLPVLSPAARIVTIGAGGGSIAWTDGIRLHVGPQSAGADPGPACYGLGGEEPTVTDALVVLGILDPDTFFGGRRRLDPARARAAIVSRIARPLGLDAMRAAAGIYEVVTARMADLIRKATVESGHDPRRFCLFAYGGGTGAHCAVFAAQLGIAKVVVPRAAPAFSALGIALSDVLYGHALSDPVALDDRAEAAETASRAFAALRARALDDMAASGIPAAKVRLAYRIEMRYRGQMNEVALPWPAGTLTASDLDAVKDAFEALYRRRFGHGTVRRETPLEMITYRVEARRSADNPPPAVLAGETGPATPHAARKVYLGAAGWCEAAVYRFEALAPGAALRGPAVVEADSTTIWLPPGAAARLDRYGNLEIDPGDRR